MGQKRRQLTLFVSLGGEIIEKIRGEFNPEQYRLIPAHVTLCRDDEIEHFDKVVENAKAITHSKPLCIKFNPPERFSGGKGVFIPAKEDNPEFYELRKKVLEGLNEPPEKQFPHITLMHPRNSVCTDLIFREITTHKFPTELNFDKISLIEQNNGGKWNITEQFLLS